MPKVLRIAKERKVEEVSPDSGVALGDWDVRAVLLQTLIPLGLEAAPGALPERGDGPGRPALRQTRWGRSPRPMGPPAGLHLSGRPEARPVGPARAGSPGGRRSAAPDIRPAPDPP